MPGVSSVAALLKSARLSFSRGDFDAARELCRNVLEAFPGEAGALHLLGLIAHRDGDLADAKDLLRRATESPDTCALYLLTYADLFCKSADRKAAVELARRATEMDRALPLGWSYLGYLLLDMRQLEESRRCLRRAIEVDAGLWQARTHLAVALGRLGEAAEAVALFECLLGEQAGNAEIIGSFAAFLADQGRYAEALIQAELAIAKQPDKLDHHVRAGEIEMLMGRHQAALARLAAIENRWPHELNLLTLKAHLLRSDDRCGEAIALCRGALDLGVESADLLRAYGLALQFAGEEAEALAAFDRSAKLNPAPALSDKGALLAHLGRLAEAFDVLEEALTHDPAWAAAWYNKSNAKSHAGGDADLGTMERLLGRCSYQDEMLLHFALGNAHMEAGDEDRAFAHWHEGNRMKRASIDYDADAAAGHIALCAGRWPTVRAEEAAGQAHLSDVPVFVVGMPRCGSSLVEQILASHPEIHGAGELARQRALFEASKPGAEPIAAVALERLRRFSPRAAPRIVDKDLYNFLHLGVIHTAPFPRARIIHCRRNPLDTCFSAYTKLFAGDFGFTYEQRELGAYYRRYHALMAHWRSMLPPQVFMEIDYETLVAQPSRAGNPAAASIPRSAVERVLPAVLRELSTGEYLEFRAGSPADLPVERRRRLFAAAASAAAHRGAGGFGAERRCACRCGGGRQRERERLTQGMPPITTADQLLETATAHHRAGKFAEARPLYQQVLAQLPAHTVALFRSGLLELQDGHPESALPLVERAAAADSGEPRYLFVLGQTLQALRRFEPAVVAYESALKLQPDFLDAWNNLGICLQLRRQLPQAAAAYRRALALDPANAGAMANLGTVLREMGDFPEAIELLCAAAGLEPAVASHAVNLGIAFWNQGRFADAESTLNQALSRHPNDAEALFNLGNALHGLGRSSEAIDRYRQALAPRPGYVDALINLGNVQAEIGEFAEGLASYAAALDARPDSVVALNNAACLMRTLGRVDDAEAALRRALELDAGNATLHDTLGNVYKDAGDLDAAT